MAALRPERLRSLVISIRRVRTVQDACGFHTRYKVITSVAKAFSKHLTKNYDDRSKIPQSVIISICYASQVDTFAV